MFVNVLEKFYHMFVQIILTSLKVAEWLSLGKTAQSVCYSLCSCLSVISVVSYFILTRRFRLPYVCAAYIKFC